MTGHKRRLLALFLGLNLLCGCAAGTITRSSDQILFYYCRADLQSGDQAGALATEPAGIGPSAEPEQALARYPNGPQDETLVLPLQKDTACTVEALQDGLLTLRLEGQELPAETVQDSLLAACLTLTMLQLDSVETVSLVRVSEKSEQLDGPYTADSFLLADASAQNPEYAVSLYYPGRNGLLVERRQILNASDASQLPALALQALISGTPVNPERAVPAATQVLGLFHHGRDGKRRSFRCLHGLRYIGRGCARRSPVHCGDALRAGWDRFGAALRDRRSRAELHRHFPADLAPT